MATFKAQVVLEMLQEEKTVAQIAAEHSIHPGQLHRWKRHALDNFAHLFTEPQALRQQAEGHEQERLELYAKIGQLTTQLEWLKKIWPRPFRAMNVSTSLTVPPLIFR